MKKYLLLLVFVKILPLFSQDEIHLSLRSQVSQLVRLGSDGKYYIGNAEDLKEILGNHYRGRGNLTQERIQGVFLHKEERNMLYPPVELGEGRLVFNDETHLNNYLANLKDVDSVQSTQVIIEETRRINRDNCRFTAKTDEEKQEICDTANENLRLRVNVIQGNGPSIKKDLNIKNDKFFTGKKVVGASVGGVITFSIGKMYIDPKIEKFVDQKMICALSKWEFFKSHERSVRWVILKVLVPILYTSIGVVSGWKISKIIENKF